MMRLERVTLEPLYAAREEIYPDVPGAEQLRERILDAHERGDPALGALQGEYRSLVHGTASTVTRECEWPTSTTSRAIPRSLIDAGRRREIEGYLCSWDMLAPQVDEDGEEYWQLIDRHAFDRCLATGLEGLLMGFNHDPDVGHFVAFHPDSRGLRAIAVVDDTPAGDLVLEAADDGRVPGFSLHALIRRYEQLGFWRGLRVVRALDLELLEAGPVTSPADELATVEFVRGERPLFRKLQDARDRDELWRKQDAVMRDRRLRQALSRSYPRPFAQGMSRRRPGGW